VLHSRSWHNASVNLKPVEEMFNAIKNTNEFLLDSAGTFSRLGA
jgi:hypothetical protein